MKQKIGHYINETTGETRERYLIMGRAIKDAEYKTVGAKGTSMLTVTLSPGREEDLVKLKLWGFDAVDYSGIRKGAVVLADAYEDTHEWEGKTYTEYVPLNTLVMGEAPQPADVEKKSRRNRGRKVEPENPVDEGFTDITNLEELPF